MIDLADLSRLSEISTADKTVLSVYISAPDSLEELDDRFKKIRDVLKTGAATRDEREYFEENVSIVKKYLRKHPLEQGSLSVFACWGLDFFQTHALPVPVKDMVWFDSSPYVRPLVEMNDEYENVAVVIADNKKARIFMISSAVPGPGTTVEGNIKNHVKKGGWSQQRYERRRDKQLLHYAREIVDSLLEIEKTERIHRIVLVGGKEILRIITGNLPKHFQDMVGQKAIDLHKGDSSVNSEIMDLFVDMERSSEANLWEKIRTEFLRGGLGVVGIEEVLECVKRGQVEEIIVIRELAVPGIRCRDCERLQPTGKSGCSECGSTSVFEVDLVNEITELAIQTGASVDFCDPMETLEKAGGIGAYLRYKYE